MEVKRWTYASALNPVSELDVQTGRMKTFVYASRGNVPDLMTVREGATVTTYRFATDHLGSVRMVVNANCPQTVLPQDVYASCVVWHADYDEYGRRTLSSQSNPELHSFGFAGGLFDYETGLTRFGARDYDAYTGRWTARDPVLFDGGQTNLYAYVNNDPVNRSDPTGLCADECQDLSESYYGECIDSLGSWQSQEGDDSIYKQALLHARQNRCWKEHQERVMDCLELCGGKPYTPPQPRVPWSESCGGGFWNELECEC